MNNEPQTPMTEETAVKEDSGALKTAKWLYDVFEMMGIAIVAVVIIFAFCFRTCRVDGHSMNKTLSHGEIVITSDFMYEPQAGDIVVFHLVNDYYQEPLVKRVIATEGQEIRIDLTEKKLYIDGKQADDKHAYLENDYYNPGYFNYETEKDDNGHDIYTATVPEGKIFVMGDNRNHSTDSRSFMVGFIDVDCVLGKAICRLSPFTSLNQ